MSEKHSLPSPTEYIANVFDEGGYLSQRFHGYRKRTGQVALAEAIDDALGTGDHLMSEAPCGVGKSLAYLVPATYRASASQRAIIGKRLDPNIPEKDEDWAPAHVIVVTGGIALQEQLVNKDLPLLSEILPWDFSYGIMKARSHYLCIDSYYDTKARALTQGQMPVGDEIDQIEDIKLWAKDCIDGLQSGDVSELPFEPNHKIWRQFSVAADECRGDDCDFKTQCFSNAAHNRARAANIVVTNYHMLLAHLQVRAATGMDLVLPKADAIILDESHLLADVARDFFGFAISKEAVTRTARRLAKEGGVEDRNAEQALRLSAEAFFGALVEYKMSGKYKTRIKTPLVTDGRMESSWKWLASAMASVEECLTEHVNRLEFQVKEHVGQEPGVKKAISDYRRSRDRLIVIRNGIKAAMLLDSADEYVYFIDIDERHRVRLSGKPIHVGPHLRAALFNKTSSVICTSATLLVDDKFDFVAEEIGCDRYAKLITESPFDFESQAILVTPKSMPDPNDPEFKEAVAEAIYEIIKIAGGRTLALFTSNRVLGHAYTFLKPRLDEMGIHLLKQGAAPRMKLISAFKEDVTSVLLGTDSFWAGVDVPGEALSVVVMDRLPFPPPDDPIADAIMERDKKGWFNYCLPRAVIQTKQGFGRLIRASDDRGAVVLLDNRITSKPYGKTFIRSLPRTSRGYSLDEIAEYVRRSANNMTSEELEDAFS